MDALDESIFYPLLYLSSSNTVNVAFFVLIGQSVLFRDVNDLILSPMFGALIAAVLSLLVLCSAIVAFVRHRVCSGKRQIATKGRQIICPLEQHE